MSIKQLLDHNKNWAAEQNSRDPDYFNRLSKLQAPDYLWIGCSDSRVPANVITGLAPGEVFVHRNVANLVHPGDINLLSVLEYAVDALQVKHIIVCGHYGCGGIRAAVDGDQHGIIDHWLQPIRDIAEQNAGVLASFEDEEARQNRLCELTIEAQVQSLARTPIIRAARTRGFDIQIHGWVYGLSNGLLHDLHCCSGEHKHK
ncbi:MAG: carbonic anhydrase [Rhizobiaceae bacterium]|nr:carbonic anhydrase [Rhizobiaceae bacterium]MBL4696795.1 carbonic anhydrase [Rhizobiaceae bacterium]